MHTELKQAGTQQSANAVQYTTDADTVAHANRTQDKRENAQSHTEKEVTRTRLTTQQQAWPASLNASAPVPHQLATTAAPLT